MNSVERSEVKRSTPERSQRQLPLRRFYRPELDVLRLFAFASVFTLHSLQQRYGLAFERSHRHIVAVLGFGAASGLPLFFFLSAYLITELLLRERDSTGTIRLRQFYIRRTLRIWPLYYLGISFGILNAILVPFRTFAAWQIVCMVFFLGWYRHDTYINEVDILWSISVEELFYLLWPTIVKFGGRTAIIWVSAVLIPIALLAASYMADSWFNPLVQSLFFAVGALFAVGLKGNSLAISISSRIGLLALGLLAWIYSAQIRGEAGASYLLIAAGCVLLFASTLGVPERYLPKPLIYLGKISYGLYVFHLFSIEATGFAVRRCHLRWTAGEQFALIDSAALAVTIAVAMCSYQFFEMPFLRLKEKFAVVKSRAA